MLVTAAFLATLATLPPRPAYAVAIGDEAAKDPAWKAVAEALVAKHGGAANVPLVTFNPAKPESLIEPLKPIHPTYLAIVVRPSEAGRDVVGGIHRATRKLDDDPYGDTRWGLVTGRTPEGAMALAKQSAPLSMTSAAGTADFPMQLFPKHWWWSEEGKHSFTMHPDGGEAKPKLDAMALAKDVADAVNAGPIDLFLSSGHATERGLELGFRQRAGRIGPKDGKIVVECVDGSVLPVSSTNPKAWIGVGNCLIGHVDGPDSAACTLIDSFGVRAHVGYVVVTWFGRGGWGTLSWFTDQAGRYTLNEAWFLNNQAILDELLRRFPAFVDRTFDGWSQDKPEQFAANVAREAGHLGLQLDENAMRDLAGLLWDRDAVAYIGDPAWDARIAPHEQPFTIRDESTAKEMRIGLAMDKESRGVPPAFFPSVAFAKPTIAEGQELDPLLTDDFCMLRKANDLKPGTRATLVVRDGSNSSS